VTTPIMNGGNCVVSPLLLNVLFCILTNMFNIYES